MALDAMGAMMLCLLLESGDVVEVVDKVPQRLMEVVVVVLDSDPIRTPWSILYSPISRKFDCLSKRMVYGRPERR